MLRSGVVSMMLSAFLILAFASGCGESSVAPVSPPVDESITIQDATGPSTGHQLWGYYDVTIDLEKMLAEVIPIRTAEMTVNVTQFLQPKWSSIHLVSIEIDLVDSDPENGLIVCDVILKHPFPGAQVYRGFDVRGILMGGWERNLDHDSMARYGGPGTLELLNADGHARWWNPIEFGPKDTIFGYTQGGRAPVDYTPNATLNGYKYFADELGPDDEIDLNPANRGTFANSPGVNSRRYEIQFPMAGGSPVYRFGYAIDASWHPPDESGAPNYPIGSFPSDANCAEPYFIKVTDNGSDAWFKDENDHGGSLKLAIEVFDWQSVENPDGVEGELSGLWIEGEPFGDPIDILPIAEILPGGDTSQIFQIELNDLNLYKSGEYEIWIIAESADPDSYEPQIEDGTSGFTWPDSNLAAYLLSAVEIGSISPMLAPIVAAIDPDEGERDTIVDITVTGQHFEDGCQVELRDPNNSSNVIQGINEIWVNDGEVDVTFDLSDAELGNYDVVAINLTEMEGILPDGFEVVIPPDSIIYVDSSNTMGIEDGSEANPYNTIHEGLAAAGDGDEVRVDDSGTPYYGDHVIPVRVSLKSVNWDESDGDDEATIQANNGSVTLVTGADGARIDGFELIGTFAMVWRAATGIEVDGGSMDITNCTIHDFNNDAAKGIWLKNGSLSYISDVEIYDISNFGYNFAAIFYGILAEDCSSAGGEYLLIERTTIHDIKSYGFYDGKGCSPHGIRLDNSDGAKVINSIVYSVHGGHQNMLYGVTIMNSDDVEIQNIVVYDMYLTFNLGNAFGIKVTDSDNVDIRNILICYVRDSGSASHSYGVTSAGSTNLTYEYNDTWFCSTSLYQNVTPGTGCISEYPEFVTDDSGHDFHLIQNVSPCIDTGDPSILDPDESISDMGAYGGPGGSW